MNLNFDLHIHTDYSDGSMSMEELPGALDKAGIKLCGITDHFEIGHFGSVKMNPKDYEKKFDELKENLRNLGIKTLLGAETGLCEDGLLLPKEVPTLDYLIASLHRMPDINYESEGTYWDKYMEIIEKCSLLGGFNILGHVEGYLPIKPFMPENSTFEDRRDSEKHFAKKYFTLDWYKKLGGNLLKNKIAVEIHEPTRSPRLEVLGLMKEIGVKFSFGTDSHSLSQIGKREYFSEVVKTLDLKPENFVIESIRGNELVQK